MKKWSHQNQTNYAIPLRIDEKWIVSDVTLHCAGGMQTYLRKNSLFFARSLRTLAMGLLICLRARTPNLAAGNAPTTIATHQGRDNSFRSKQRERHIRTSKQHLTLFTAGWREHMVLTSNFAGRTSGKPGREEWSEATMRRRGWDQTNLM